MEEVYIEILKIFAPYIFGFLTAVWLYRNPQTRNIEIVTKLFSIRSEKFREIIKNDYNITKLKLVDERGRHINPYKLRIGRNTFKCIATYTDGSTSEYSPYWLCWEEGSRSGWEVFGKSRKREITLSESDNHAKYMELSCWVFTPSSTESNTHIPHDSIGFIYKR